jgi:long-chain acyl-CoA synthetase
MYEAQLPDDWTYILNDSGAKTVFCANDDIYRRVKETVLPNTPLVSHTFVLDHSSPDAAAATEEEYSFAHAMSKYEPDVDHKLTIAPTFDDLANLIYTSGTTGKVRMTTTTSNQECNIAKTNLFFLTLFVSASSSLSPRASN